MAGNLTNVFKLYSTVMDDVVSGVREYFLDEGIDDQVLTELKQMWKTKLSATKAVDEPGESQQHSGFLTNKSVQEQSTGNAIKEEPETVAAASSQHQQQSAHLQQPSKQFMPNPMRNNQQTTLHPMLDMDKLVPVQITLPSTPPRIFSIQLPEAALSGNQLNHVLTGPVMSAALELPHNVASTFLQQHITAAIQAQSTSMSSTLSNNINKNPTHAPSENLRRFPNISQLDGITETSDEDENDDDDDDDNDDMDNDDEDDDDDDDDEDDDKENDSEDKEDDEIDLEPKAEEEPLNSGDDVSESDAKEMFETDNVIVCQFDKITRSRNKWKFYLKDGIMNIFGKDYVFQKAGGEAEW